MEEVSIITALLAGLLSFLSPCLVPLLPAYFGLLVGETSEDVSDKKLRWRVFRAALFYVMGFTLVFWMMGVSANALGKFITSNVRILQQVGGIFVLLFGMHISGMLRFGTLDKEARLRVPSAIRNMNVVGPFLIGIAFALGWTPCFGPVLGAILFLASMQDTILQGGFLLLVYAAGIGLPFIILSLVWGNIAVYIKKMDHWLKYIHVLGGVFLIILGILMVTGYLDAVNAWSFENLLHWLQPIYDKT